MWTEIGVGPDPRAPPLGPLNLTPTPREAAATLPPLALVFDAMEIHRGVASRLVSRGFPVAWHSNNPDSTHPLPVSVSAPTNTPSVSTQRAARTASASKLGARDASTSPSPTTRASVAPKDASSDAVTSSRPSVHVHTQSPAANESIAARRGADVCREDRRCPREVTKKHYSRALRVSQSVAE